LSGADEPPVGRPRKVARDRRGPTFAPMPDPTNKELQSDAEEAEDARIAAEEESEIADEDEAAVENARDETVPRR